MKKILITIFFLLNSIIFSFGQKPKDILNEGKLLYRLEKASWHGTDHFLEHFSDKKDSIGGYLSYVNENNKVINIFFKKDNPFHIIVRYEFESLPTSNPINIDTLKHSPSQQEIDLITIRQDAIKRIYENQDNFFSFYKNTSLNLIPLIHKNERKVFVLTGPQNSGVVIIGNDYLLTYNKKNKFKKKEKIHNSLIEFPYKSDVTFHSHVLSNYINSTDICTLLLYKDFVEWKQHYVVSKKYVSIFDLEKEDLIILTRKDWEKMNDKINKKDKE